MPMSGAPQEEGARLEASVEPENPVLPLSCRAQRLDHLYLSVLTGAESKDPEVLSA